MYLSKSDIDYWDQLSDEERAYLNSFLAEHYGGNKTHNSPFLETFRKDNPHLSEDQIQDAYRVYRNERKRANYRRKNCSLNKATSLELFYNEA